MTIVTSQVLVDPERMLVVTVRKGGPNQEIVSVSCRYVPVGSGDRRQIAVELAFDPKNNKPTQPYYCPTERLQRVLLAPRDVVRIRPYAI